MATEVHPEAPKAGELPLPGYAAWSPNELQAKLAEIGAPTQGSREELVERLKTYTLQTGIVLNRPVLRGDDGDKLTPPPMPVQVSSLYPKGVPKLRPGGRMQPIEAIYPAPTAQGQEGVGLNDPRVGPPPSTPGMGPPPLRMQAMDPSALHEEERLILAHQQAAMLIQQEERDKQVMAVYILRNEYASKTFLKIVHPICFFLGIFLGTPPLSSPVGMPGPRLRGPPPPPGEDSREIDDSGVGPKIPQALEKILQLKEIRQEELTAVPSATGNHGLLKNRKRRNRKKKKKPQNASAPKGSPAAKDAKGHGDESGSDTAVEIEYVTEEPEIYDPNFIFFKRIFEAFKLTDDVKKDKEKEPEKADKVASSAAPKKKGFEEERKDSDDSSDDEQEKKPEVPKLSKKKLRRMNRFTVAELKQLVARPDVVEMHDVTAQDPKLLVHLKATRNSVPVPRHWCFKRKYLQGKRGIEKPPFELPEFIKRTGIQEMREALQEKEEQKTMKSKMREKVRPKMGKIDIDYQKLHDAFFKWQTKPKLTIHGDLYYEGKEFETRLKEKKPGDLSDELRIALGMPVGPNAHKVPPPWLIAMQRYGPPPSYPNLKIPGLNSPIPEVRSTCVLRYSKSVCTALTMYLAIEEWHLYSKGDLFIYLFICYIYIPDKGQSPPNLVQICHQMGSVETPQLFTVLPEKRTATVGGAMMGSTHIYDMATVMSRKGPVPEIQGVEVALAPEELELDPMAMTQKYEEHVREQQAQVEKEDFSDMVAEHAAKQKQKKRKAQPQDTRAGAKKYKEFKF
uniref:SAP domain-containing protein n=1 Tax=Anolis carolinensis TaxID=28377 RepID=H9GQ49_ANOCA